MNTIGPVRVLFLCIHNSARSQMAEAYLKKYGGDKFVAESAGLEAGNLNPFAVEVMKEEGMDLSGNQTKSVEDFFRQGRSYEYVISVCDESSASACPVFPGANKKINWSFPDPSTFSGTHEERLSATRKVRDQIKNAVIDWLEKLT